MIFNKSIYNPLETIFKYNLVIPTPEALSVVQHELFKAGIVPETADEFQQVLNLLVETEREYYGKK